MPGACTVKWWGSHWCFRWTTHRSKVITLRFSRYPDLVQCWRLNLTRHIIRKHFYTWMQLKVFQDKSASVLTYHLAAVHPSCSSSLGREEQQEKEQTVPLIQHIWKNLPLDIGWHSKWPPWMAKPCIAFVGRRIKAGSIRITKNDCIYSR